MQKGVLSDTSKKTLIFDYGDVESLEKLFSEYPNQISAVMLEPATHQTPYLDQFERDELDHFLESGKFNGNNFLSSIKQLCKKNGAILIFDEMITGFRFSNGVRALINLPISFP